MKNNKFTDFFIKIFKEKDISYSDASKISGLSKGALHNIVNRKTPVNVRSIKKLELIDKKITLKTLFNLEIECATTDMNKDPNFQKDTLTFRGIIANGFKLIGNVIEPSDNSNSSNIVGIFGSNNKISISSSNVTPQFKLSIENEIDNKDEKLREVITEIGYKTIQKKDLILPNNKVITSSSFLSSMLALSDDGLNNTIYNLDDDLTKKLKINMKSLLNKSVYSKYTATTKDNISYDLPEYLPIFMDEGKKIVFLNFKTFIGSWKKTGVNVQEMIKIESLEKLMISATNNLYNKVIETTKISENEFDQLFIFEINKISKDISALYATGKEGFSDDREFDPEFDPEQLYKLILSGSEIYLDGSIDTEKIPEPATTPYGNKSLAYQPLKYQKKTSDTFIVFGYISSTVHNIVKLRHCVQNNHHDFSILYNEDMGIKI